MGMDLSTEYTALKALIDESFTKVCKSEEEFVEYDKELRSTIGARYKKLIDTINERCMNTVRPLIEQAASEKIAILKERIKECESKMSENKALFEEAEIKRRGLSDLKDIRSRLIKMSRRGIKCNKTGRAIEKEINSLINEIETAPEDPDSVKRRLENTVEHYEEMAKQPFGRILGHFMIVKDLLDEELEKYEKYFDLGHLIVSKYNAMSYRKMPDVTIKGLGGYRDQHYKNVTAILRSYYTCGIEQNETSECGQTYRTPRYSKWV